jgi:hypothetical protein
MPTFAVTHGVAGVHWEMDEAKCTGMVRPIWVSPRVIPFGFTLGGVSAACEFLEPGPNSVALEVLLWSGGTWTVVGTLELENTYLYGWKGRTRASVAAASLLVPSITAGAVLAVRESADGAYAGIANLVSVSCWFDLVDDTTVAPLYWDVDSLFGVAPAGMVLDQYRSMPWDANLLAVSWGAREMEAETGKAPSLTVQYLPPLGAWTTLHVCSFSAAAGHVDAYGQYKLGTEITGLPPGGILPEGSMLRVCNTSAVGSADMSVSGTAVILWFGNVAPPPPVQFVSWQRELRLAFDDQGITPR